MDYDFIKNHKNKITHVQNKEYKSIKYVVYEDNLYIIIEKLEKKLRVCKFDLYIKLFKSTYELNEITIDVIYINKDLKTINEKKVYDKISSILDFIIKYSEFDTYNNNKFNKKLLEKLNNTDINYLIYLRLNTNIKINTLYKIFHKFKKTRENKYKITNLFIDPYKFIEDDCSYITFNLADNINKLWNLNINFTCKLRAKIIDIINVNNGGPRNSFWIEKFIFNKEIKEYCKKNNKIYENCKEFINENIHTLAWNISKKKIQEMGNEKLGFDKQHKEKTREYVYKNNKSYINFCKKQDDPNYLMQQYINYYNGYEEYISTKYLFKLEVSLTKDIKKINNYNKEQDYDKEKIEELIENYEEQIFKNRFDIKQKEAILNIFNNNFSILTGPPGSGKTDIVKCILYIKRNYEDNYNSYKYEDKYEVPTTNVCIMAPTGQAFNTITKEMTKEDYDKEISGTCHKVLYQIFNKKCELENLDENIIQYKRENDKKWNEKFYETIFDFIIVDEFSMIDLIIFKELLKVCKHYKSKLLIIGDVEQFPPIGPGNPLQKIIKSDFFLANVSKLTKIYRQEEGTCLSNIINKMHEGNKITIEDFNKDKTAIFINIADEYNSFGKNEKLKNFIHKLQQDYCLDKETKFLCFNTSYATNDDGTRKYIFNTHDLNKIIQDLFNPINENFDNNIIKSTTDDKREFRINDKIIRNYNDYSDEEKMRANGEEATIDKLEDGENIIISYSDEKSLSIPIYKLFEEFDLNYTTGFHKSQGGGWNTIVVFIQPNASFIKQKAIYTSISRSKKKLIFISTPEDLLNCQKPDEEGKSYFMNKQIE
jgi:hypothetical protein